MKKLLAIVLAMLMLLACVPAFAEEEAKIITVGKNFDYNGKTFIHDQTLENNYYADVMYEVAGVKFEYEWILNGDEQKIAAAVAAGDMPDVMIVNLAQFNMLIESNMLADLTDAFENNANALLLACRENYQEAFAAASVGGRLMAIPTTMVKKQHSLLWVRQDWLNNLGLEVPKTMDDLIEVATAFVNDDPDQNGENDTIGLTLNSDIFSNGTGGDHIANPIANYFGAYPEMWYQQDDGSVIYGSVTPEFREALEFIAGLYADGLIDPQFAVDTPKELCVSGKCGLAFGPWCAGFFTDSWAYDGADWIPVACPLDDDGLFKTTNPTPATSYMVVSKDCEYLDEFVLALGAEYDFHRMTTDNPDWLAKMTEYQNTGVSWTIMPLAIQLEHEDIVAQRGIDMKQMIENDGDRTGVSAQNQAFYDAWLKHLEDPTYLVGQTRYRGMYLACNVANGSEHVFTSPCFWDMTATMKEVWTTLTSMEDEIVMKVIMGESSIEEYDAFVEQWYALGGEQIIEEVQAYVDARG